MEGGIRKWVKEEAATEGILGVCNLFPQEVGHALPALGLPLEIPLNILEVCHDPHQTVWQWHLPSPPSLPISLPSYFLCMRVMVTVNFSAIFFSVHSLSLSLSLSLSPSPSLSPSTSPPLSLSSP